MGLWSLIVPQESYNKVLNPSAEIAGNFSAVGASCTVTRSASLSYRGVYSYKIDTDVAANSGIDLVTTALSNGIYYVSFRVTSLGGVATLRVSLDNNAHYNTAALLFTDGTVLHYGVQIPAAEANASVSLHIMQEAGAVKTFYIDCVQCEQLSTWTTYVDGDEPGCRWEGLPHGSQSYRPANERSGGYVRELVATYGVYVESVTGLSGPTKELLLEPRALIDGNVVQGQRSAMRAIGLTVSIKGTSLANFYSLKKAFLSAISRHLVVPQQPVTFWYSGAGKIVTTRAIVESGDEGGLMDGFYEKIPLALLAADDVFWEELKEASAVVNNSTTLAVEQMVAYRPSQPWSATTGFWDNLGAPELTAGTNTIVYCFARDRSGNLYVGGDFTNLNGIANADYIAKRDVNGVWSALGTGTGGIVRAMACDAAGNLYVGGNFTNLTDANGDYISMWNGSAFVSLGTGANGAVYGLAAGADGAVYAVGAFASMGGVANTPLVAKWSGGVWSAMGTGGGTDFLYCVTVGADGAVYVGGRSANIGGVAAADYIAKWSSGAWTSVGVFDGGDVQALAVGPDGRIYTAGNFTTIDGVSIARVAVYNQSRWFGLGSGVNDDAWAVAITTGGLVFVTGAFTSAGGVTVADRAAIWNGTSWSAMPIDLPGSAIVYTLLADGNDVYLGFDTEGDATVSGLVSTTALVASTATAPSYPIITINCAVAVCTLQEVRNESTGSVIRFNRAMQIGETITIDCRPGVEQVRSDFPPPNGSQVTMLMPSDLGNFALMPGNNKVSVYAPGTGATVTVSLRWRVKHEGAEGGAT